MKKTLYAAVALVAMVACSNDYVVNGVDKEAIGFANVFVDNSTRSAVDPSYNNNKLFADFQVYAYVEGTPLFFNDEDTNTGVTVKGATVDGVTTWSYDGLKFWIPTAKYNFSAVAPKTNGNWEMLKEGAGYKTDSNSTVISFVNNGETDLLYAQSPTIEAKTTGNGAVAFTFRHILSKVKFSFKNEYNDDNTTIRVHDIKINNVYRNGVVKLDYGYTSWIGLSDKTLTLDFGGANTTKENSEPQPFGFGQEVESHYERFLIPINNELNITFKYDIIVGDQSIKTFEVESNVEINRQPGKAYDFVATITSGEPIVFKVEEIKNWDITPGSQTM